MPIDQIGMHGHNTGCVDALLCTFLFSERTGPNRRNFPVGAPEYTPEIRRKDIRFEIFVVAICQNAASIQIISGNEAYTHIMRRTPLVVLLDDFGFEFVLVDHWRRRRGRQSRI